MGFVERAGVLKRKVWQEILHIALLVVASAATSWSGEFPTVMAEPNLEKRSELALKEADRMIAAAKKAYGEDKFDDFRARIKDATDLVDLSYNSLVDTGKRGSNKLKYWKRAELAIRALLRRLDSLAAEVSSQERDVVTAAHKQLSEVHDNVLLGVMTKK